MTRPAVMDQLRDCVLNHGFALEQVLPLATKNTARVLKLREKGELRKGCAGDILLLEEGSLEIVHVLSHGTFVVRDGRVVEREAWLEDSDRESGCGAARTARRRTRRRNQAPDTWHLALGTWHLVPVPCGYPTGDPMTDVEMQDRGRAAEAAVERKEVPARAARLLVIGGAEDPDEDDMTILPYLVEMAGGKKAHIVVCSSPSENPEEKVETYGALFEKLGVAEVYPPVAHHRPPPGRRPGAAARPSGAFFTGGDQLRLTALIAGTPFCENIRGRLYGDGLIVAGTSAGAAAMSSVMIIGGKSEARCAARTWTWRRGWATGATRWWTRTSTSAAG